MNAFNSSKMFIKMNKFKFVKLAPPTRRYDLAKNGFFVPNLNRQHKSAIKIYCNMSLQYCSLNDTLKAEAFLCESETL